MATTTFFSLSSSRKAQPEIGDLLTVKITASGERTCGARLERWVEGMAAVRVVDNAAGQYPSKGQGFLVAKAQIIDWEGR